MIGRALALLARAAGADPVRVRALARALRAEARGQLTLQYEERGERGLHPDTSRVLLLVVLALTSVGVAVAAVALRDRLLLAGLVLMSAQAGAAFVRAAAEVVPVVLGSDDRAVLGWWPVTERELLLARGLLVLESVVEGSAAVLSVPLVAFAVAASPPVLPALTVIAGAGLQSIALAAVMVLFVQSLGRLLGRRRARRLAEVLSTVILVIALNVAVRAVRPWLADLGTLSPWLLMVAPVTWFAAWSAVWQPMFAAVVGVLASLVATVVLVVLGIRALGRQAAEAAESATVARAGRWDWTTPLVALTTPWLGGRDGRALRLLLRAHLREDWRFTGSLMFMPVAILIYLVVVRTDDLATASHELQGLGPAATTLGLWMSLLGLSIGGAATCSTEAKAGWLIACSVQTPGRALSLQRRLVRSIVPLPLLGVATMLLVWRSGLASWQIPLVVAPAWLAFEILVVFAQCVAPAQSFSRAWRREGNEFRGFHLLLVLIWPLAMVPLLVIYDRLPWGPPIVLVSQIAMLAGMRWLLRWRVARLGVSGLDPRLGRADTS
jgi:hypothetical protein